MSLRAESNLDPNPQVIPPCFSNLNARDVSYITRNRYFWSSFKVGELRELGASLARSELFLDPHKKTYNSLEKFLADQGLEHHPDSREHTWKGVFPCFLRRKDAPDKTVSSSGRGAAETPPSNNHLVRFLRG